MDTINHFLFLKTFYFFNFLFKKENKTFFWFFSYIFVSSFTVSFVDSAFSISSLTIRVSSRLRTRFSSLNPQLIELPFHIIICSLELLVVMANNKVAQITISNPEVAQITISNPVQSIYFVLPLGDSLYTKLEKSFLKMYIVW